MSIIMTHPAVNFMGPSDITDNQWFVENFDDLSGYTVPELAVAILFYFFKPREQAEVIAQISLSESFSNEVVENLISELCKKNLLIAAFKINEVIHSDDKNSYLFYSQYEKWKKFNWGGAAEYHFFTYDYPFLDYSVIAEGGKVAQQRMQVYSQQEEDNERVKKYPENFKRIYLPWLINESSLKLRRKKQNSKITLDIESISILAATALAKMAEVSVSWQGLPLMYRTSPSGGSRHPTEGYVIALGVTGLQRGVYHIQSDPFCLTQLASQPPDGLTDAFYELYHVSNDTPTAIIFLTSVFKRNMFRYREPRTFRTVHMDAGHILGTLELVAQEFNIRTVISHQIDEKIIEEWLELDGLSEGVMTSIGLFNSKNG